MAIRQWKVTLALCVALNLAKIDVVGTVGVCEQSSTAIYNHDNSGWDLYGRLSTLFRQVEGPYLVKVQYSTADDTFTIPLDEFHFRGPHVCGTSSWILSDNGTHFGDDTNWQPIAVCTSGEAYDSIYSTSQWVRNVTSQPLPIMGKVTWFTKPTSCDGEAIYSNYFDGSVISGSKAKLLKYAKTSSLKINMRDRGYSVITQNNNVYDDQLITSQSLDHLSLKNAAIGLIPNDLPFYKWHGVWASSGRRDISRWQVASMTSHGHENDQVALDWFGDDCWRRVFSTDANGQVVYGSLEELILMVRVGHEVRVHVDGLTLKATNLQIVNGTVVALTTDEFARRGFYPRVDAPFFNTNARVVYRLIHASGKMNEYKFMIEDYSLSENINGRFAVDWLVDTRPWIKVHETGNAGSVPATDSWRNLNETIANGASIRICLEMDSMPGQLFLQTENIRHNLVTDEITLQSVKNIMTEKTPTPSDEFIIPSQASQLSFLVNANGEVSAQTRQLASKILNNEPFSNSVIKATWFANK